MNYKGDNGEAENFKKREYFKQQRQLRTMTKNTNVLSADDMIENLLSKKEIFQKKKDLNGQSTKHGQGSSWPLWLNSGKEPPLYQQVWSLVNTPNGFADTSKISNILLTSRLTTDTLGYIWSLTNLTVPGSLTQQELYISLALVALAQNGYTFTNADVVKQLLEAPIPRLDMNLIEPPLLPVTTTGQPSTPPVLPVQSTVPTVTETLSLIDISSEPVSLLDASPTKTLSILSAQDLSKDFPSVPSQKAANMLVFGEFQENDDDFDDFKSADIFSTDMSNLTVLEVDSAPVENEGKTETAIIDSEIEKIVIEDLFPKCTPKSKTLQNLLGQPDISEVPNIPPLENSLEEEDKYSALRVLASKSETESHGQDVDEFGDFLTADLPKETFSVPVQNTPIDIQKKCLQACLEVLKEAVSLFESIEDEQILSEVTNDERGKNYLEEIVEVERIGRRIRSNRENNSLITEFETLSQSLQPYIESVKNNHMDEENGPKCGLCLCEYGPAHVKYGINHFHAPCANLYLHHVDPILPIAPVM